MSATGDLVTGVGADHKVNWLYAHATLLRLFQPTTDGRSQFWGQVPGIVSALSRAQIHGTPFPNADPVIEHHLLEFPNGWLNLLGGTKALGWPGHVLGTGEVPSPLFDWFATYYAFMGELSDIDIATVIPANDTRPIVYAGHSLGGAASVYSAFVDGRRTPARERKAVTFGSPKPRYIQGMDGMDFEHNRVVNSLDPVPFMSFSMIPVHILALPLKAAGTSNFHYGDTIAFDPDGHRLHFEPNNFFLLGAVMALAATVNYGDPFQAHYIDSYAWLMRIHLAIVGAQLDPFWDQVNAFCNAAEGTEWNIPGFPAQAPPPLPSTFTPPSPVLVTEELIAAGQEALEKLQAPLFEAVPGVVVTEGLKLAAVLSSLSGRVFTDVHCRLAKAPVPDPNSIVSGDLVEADYVGYQPRGGSIWATSPSPANFLGQRYAARVGFFSTGGVVPQTLHFFYVTASEAGNPDLVLLMVHPLEGGVLIDRAGQNLVFSVELSPVVP